MYWSTIPECKFHKSRRFYSLLFSQHKKTVPAHNTCLIYTWWMNELIPGLEMYFWLGTFVWSVFDNLLPNICGLDSFVFAIYWTSVSSFLLFILLIYWENKK